MRRPTTHIQLFPIINSLMHYRLAVIAREIDVAYILHFSLWRERPAQTVYISPKNLYILAFSQFIYTKYGRRYWSSVDSNGRIVKLMRVTRRVKT